MLSNLPKNWKLLPFEKVLSEPLRNGIYKKKEFHGRGTKIVNMGELFSHPRLKNGVDMKRVELNERELDKATLLKGDLIFARRSLTAEGAGKCSIILSEDEPLTFESSIIRARLNRKLANPEYFYYLFNSPFGKWLLGTILRQVAVAGITGSDLAKLEVPVPPIDIQNQIASTGCLIDDFIEVNSQTNQTLETIAQTLFKSWFVDFDPVKAKLSVLAAGGSAEEAERAAMCAISARDEASLNTLQTEQPEAYAELARTAALFPSAMEDSELGEIPMGWEVGTISDLLDFNPKRTLKKGTPAPYLDMKNVPTSGHLAQEVVIREMASGTKFINGDTLLARITPCLENGKTAYVDFLEENQVGWGSTEYIVIRPKDGIPASIGYFIARFESFRNIAVQSMTGTSGRQRANADVIGKQTWIKYPTSLLSCFDSIAGQYLLQAKNRGDENRNLSELRNTLLPKLLSGELTLPNTTSPKANPSESDMLNAGSVPAEVMV